MQRSFVPSFCSLLCSVLPALPVLGQLPDVEIHPAYQPEGPQSKLYQVYFGEPFQVDYSLPGLDHAASKAVANQYFGIVAYAAATLPIGIPLGPTAVLYLDPTPHVTKVIPPSLEMSLSLTQPPALTEMLTPGQALFIDLSTFQLYASPLFRLHAVEAPPSYTSDRMVPLGSTAPGTTTVSYDATNNWYRCRYEHGSDVVEYVIDKNHSSVQQGTLRVSELSSALNVLMDGGIYYVEGAGQTLMSPLQFQAFGTHTLVAESLVGPTVTMDWRDELPKPEGGTVVRNRRHEFTLVGRALQVRVRSLDAPSTAANNYIAVGFGNFSLTSLALTSMKQRQVPYMDQIGITLVGNEWFHSSFVDLFQSNASNHVPAQFATLDQYGHYNELMIYPALSDGRVTPLDETSWVQVSKDIRDLFVKSTAAPSPWADKLEQRIGVTLAEPPAGGSSYAKDAEKIEQLLSFGFEDVYLLKQHWMRYGTNRRSTTHTPPNPVGGSAAEFQDALHKAIAANWRAAVYTDWYSLDQAQGFDDNPNYSETPGSEIHYGDAVRLADLSYRAGFSVAVDPTAVNTTYYFTRVLSPRRAITHWKREFDQSGGFYGSNAGYFDITCISAPDLIVTGIGTNVGGSLSLDAGSPNPRTIKDAIGSYKALFRNAGTRLQGPLVGEGSFVGFDARFDTFYWGYLDGFYRTLSTGGPPNLPQSAGQNQPILPDYEWQVARGNLYGLGLGQYTRFFYAGAPGSSYPLQDVALNEYRATEISYGHNGYFLTNSNLSAPGEYMSIAQQVKEYYTLRSLQAEWAAASAPTVSYREGATGSPWLDINGAIKSSLDLVKPVLRLTFDTGLVIVVNHTETTISESGYQIPTHGWTALNPNTGYQNLSVVDAKTGQRVDRVLAPNYELADGNGVQTVVGGAIGTTKHLWVVRYDTGVTLIENGSQGMYIQ
jgi:hypothetical protein